MKSIWAAAAAVCLLLVATGVEALEAQHPGYRATVIGKAAFEKRHTFVPMQLCVEGICPRSEPYWALVLEQDGTQYELDQAFARGSEQAPESIEVAGTVVRPGSRLSLDARVEPIARDFALLAEVNEARVVMDAARPLAPIWLCLGNHRDGRASLQAEIWKSEDAGSVASFEIRVLVAAPFGERRVATVEDLELTVHGSDVTFSGISAQGEVALTLDQSERLFANVPGTLVFRKADAGTNLRFPAAIRESLECDRAPVHH